MQSASYNPLKDAGCPGCSFEHKNYYRILNYIELKELLKDTNGNVRERAAGALWKINPQAAEPLISPIVITIYPV